MSATGQAAGGSNGGGDAGGEAAQGAAQGFDAAALQTQLQQTAGGVDELRQQFGQFLESAPWQQQAQGGEEEAETGFDLSFLDQAYGDPAYGEAERQQMGQQFGEQFDQRVQAAVAQALAPVQQAQQAFAREQQARDLVAEHPELQDREVAEAVVRQAQQVAQDMGQPELGNNPQFWKLIHQASRATAAANAEEGGADASRAAHLEGGGGAGPAGGGQVDIAGDIINSKRGGSVLPFG